MIEMWKPCVGFEEFLEVSDQGAIRSLPSVRTGIRNGQPHPQRRQGKVLSPFMGRNGYLIIAPKFGEGRKKHLLHRLIARTFVAGFSEGLTVNHINGVKTDNRAENLEWVTLARNTEHQWETGLVDLRGEKHPSSKLTAEKVLILRRLISLGIPCRSLATLVDVSPATIYLIRDGKRWQSVLEEAA